MISVNLAEIVAEARPGFASGKSDDDGYVQVRMNNVSIDGNLSLKVVRRVPRSDTKLSRFEVEKGDILFNATNSPELVGKSALFKGFTEPVVYSNHFLRVRLDQHRADPGYVSRWLQMKRSEGVFTRMCKQWVNQATVDSARLMALSLPLPPLSEQRRIAAILDQADALRAKRRAALAQLDKLGQAVFTEMFGQPGTNPNGWPIHAIGDHLASATYGTSQKASSQGSVPILRMSNITYNGKLSLAVLKYIDIPDKDLMRYTVAKGDILFNRTNSPDLVGKTAVFDQDEIYAYAGYLIRLRTKSTTAPEYVSAFLNSKHGKSVLRNMCKSIIGMANINAKEVQSILIPTPPSTLQFKFRDAVNNLRPVRDAHINTLETLDALFASLQHRAFTGAL